MTAAPSDNPKTPRIVRSRQRPNHPQTQQPAPDLNTLFGLDRLDQADADALMRAQVLNQVESRFRYHEALAHWLRMWGRLDDRRQYVVLHGFVAVVTRHDDTRNWSWSVAREVQRGAQPGPRLALVSYYSSDTAAKIACYDFASALLLAEARGPGEPR